MTERDVKFFFDYKYQDGACLCVAANKSTIPLQLGNCTNIKQTTESLIVAAMRKDSENVIFHSTNIKYPLVYFFYRRGNIIYAFQVSIGSTHSCKPNNLKDAIEEAGSDHAFLLHYLTFDEKYDEYELDNPFLKDNNISIRNSLADDWTSPYEKYMGRPKKDDRKLLPLDEIIDILKNEPRLLEQLLKTDTSITEQLDSMILMLTRIELSACARCLKLPRSGKKGELIKRLQNDKDPVNDLILRLQKTYGSTK